VVTVKFKWNFQSAVAGSETKVCGQSIAGGLLSIRIRNPVEASHQKAENHESQEKSVTRPNLITTIKTPSLLMP
jgi:hypothetical protein